METLLSSVNYVLRFHTSTESAIHSKIAIIPDLLFLITMKNTNCVLRVPLIVFDVALLFNLLVFVFSLLVSLVLEAQYV